MEKNRTKAIILQAKKLGADLAGIASMVDVTQAPSFRIRDKLPDFNGIGTLSSRTGLSGPPPWPTEARSAIVIAVAHPTERPELDWWVTGPGSGNTAGNRILITVVERLAAWLEQEQGIHSFPLPYHLEKNGMYMKDAAVIAGLGCIGKNNLLVSPRFGPRLRLRMMLIDRLLPTTGPSDYNPCRNCPMPCLQACPQQAFSKNVYEQMDYGIDTLPGRTGTYDRLRCNRQMELDLSAGRTVALKEQTEPGRQVRYCRSCELACPIGRP